jgi:hypothetical protein
MGIKSAKYSLNNRLQIDLAPGIVMCVWNVDWFSYNWGDTYLLNTLNGTLNAAKDPPIAGDWTLGEVKSFKAAKAEFDTAVHNVRAKLGNDWDIEIDWASTATNTKGINGRNDLGKVLFRLKCYRECVLF